MKTLGRFLTVVMVGVFASALAFGQDASFSIRGLKNETSTRSRAKAFSPSADSLSAENVNNYFIGYDFSNTRKFILSEDTRNAIAQLAILWDELSGQSEAGQMEVLLQMQIRSSGTVKDRLNKLDALQAAVEMRLKGEQRWFYNVGKTYSHMFIAADTSDGVAIKADMAELGKLSKTAPASSPVAFTTALAKLGELGAKASLTDAEAALIKTECEAIDKVIYG